MWQRRAGRLFVGLWLLAAGASEGVAEIRTWNGPASPCGSTLQDCINGAAAGDIVRVATNTPIAQHLTIDKSLTLRAATGFTPVMDTGRFVTFTNPNPRANSVVFEGFTLSRGQVSAVQLSTAPFDVVLRSLTFLDVPVAFKGIDIRTGAGSSFGQFTFSITDNEMTLVSESQIVQGETAIGVFNEDAVSMRGVIRNNRIDHFSGGQMGAIQLLNLDHALEVDVIGNEIRGSNYNYGITATQSQNGTSRYRILDNLVVGQKSVAYGILNTAGECDFQIINNTAVNGDQGIRADGSGPQVTTGIVANNIVANMASVGLALDQSISSGVVERNNLIWASPQFDNFVPGPGTLLRDPRFVGGSNYRLTVLSPARNAGDDASVPVDLLTDLDGSERRIGHVDMGAYESTITVSSPPVVADGYRLHPNFPNPFNPTTTIQYELQQAGPVHLAVFDAQGRLVRWLVPGTVQGAGPHQYLWDGRSALGTLMPSGVYFCRLEAGPFVDAQRMVLAR